MTAHRKLPDAIRLAATLLLCGSATLLAGCSQEFASVDDVYVPVASEQRFPIQVVEKPFKLSVSAGTGKLVTDDVNRLALFAKAAQSSGASPVIVSYPTGSRKAAGVSAQAVEILRKHGVERGMIRKATYNGKSDVVSLSFTRKMATSKECGDWSQDLSSNSMNEPYPNAGCFMQLNLAAMVVNPEDFEDPIRRGAHPASSKILAIQDYQSGEWTDPANSSGATIEGIGQ